MRSVRKLRERVQGLFGGLAEKAATESGVIQRRRVFTGTTLASTFLLAFLKNPHAGRRELAEASALVGAPVSPQAIDQRWIDYEPRVGKRPGGFCTTSPLLAQSRIFMTYSGTPADVLTLAHELGHGFHNWSMRGLRPWACVYPMTLAETASTFCEQVVMDALLERAAGREQQLRLLEARLQDAASFLLNIPMRYWFERARAAVAARQSERPTVRRQPAALWSGRRSQCRRLRPAELRRRAKRQGT